MSQQVHITSIIYDKRGRPISIGHNSYVKTHPLQAKLAKQVNRPLKVFLHAEVDAILRAGDKIHGAYMMRVFRYDKSGRPVNAKPCPICQELINMTPIKVVQHT